MQMTTDHRQSAMPVPDARYTESQIETGALNKGWNTNVGVVIKLEDQTFVLSVSGTLYATGEFKTTWYTAECYGEDYNCPAVADMDIINEILSYRSN